MFRGYVKTINKECKMAFKGVPDDQLLSLKEAEKLSEYAGILAQDVVLIDVDDYDQSEILMNMVEDLQLRCRVYKTTRGKHFLFKNVINSEGLYLFDKALIDTNLACGIRADIKLGCKNGYSILKFKNEKRSIIYDIFEDEEYQEAPKWLIPIKSKIDFSSLSEGDGRNQTLFNYILTLQSNGFNKEESKKCLELINKYVMRDSLSEKELEVITRDSAFKKEIFFAGNVFLFDKFSNYLMNNACIKKINGNLYIYRNGVYVNGSDYIEKEMIKNIAHLKASHRTEVLKYLNLIVEEATPCTAYKIAFENGIYDLSSNEISNFSPELIITNKIEWNYNPNAYSEIADRTLNKLACGDKYRRMLLEECIGYCFFRRNELRKSFMLVGDRHNGKSTFLQMLTHLLGDDNISALELNEIGDRFRTAAIAGKLANIGDDIENDFITKTGIFKKVVSGSEIVVEDKGQKPYTIKPYSKFLFSANEIPRFKDKTGAVKDRLVIVRFLAKFSPDDEDYDPFIITKLMQPEVMEYLINIGLQGLKRVLSTNKFSMSAEDEKELVEFDEKNNPILIFFKSLSLDEIIDRTSQEIYLRYSDWCIQEGIQALGNIEFSRQLGKHFNILTKTKKVNGKVYRVYALK